MMWMEEVVAYFTVLFRHLSGGTEKDRNNIRIVLSQLEFEPDNALIYISETLPLVPNLSVDQSII
jgi:hypothetical protein